MSRFKHTIGPWNIRGSVMNGVPFEVWTTRASEDKQSPVCAVFCTPGVEEKANAGLIKNAPETLGLLYRAAVNLNVHAKTLDGTGSRLLRDIVEHIETIVKDQKL